MNSEMFSYLRPDRGGQALVAVYRLPAGKHAGILTHFHTKINQKIVFFGRSERSLSRINPYPYFQFSQ